MVLFSVYFLPLIHVSIITTTRGNTGRIEKKEIELERREKEEKKRVPIWRSILFCLSLYRIIHWLVNRG